MRFHSLLLSSLLSITCSTVAAHPVSYTDAWGKVSEHFDLKLNIFLDDIVRHQIGPPEDHDLISAEDLQQAIRRHTTFLPGQLHVFNQRGQPLSVSVTAVPDWRPRGTEVKLSENNLVKLTWRLRYTSPGADPEGFASLCFLHSFTHSDLTSAGELRMHLQHVTSGNRIDAVIPPALPHTILLPRTDSGVRPDAEPNGAMSRLILSPTGIVHEFTVPLLLLEDAWPPAKTFRAQSASPGNQSAPVTIGDSDIAAGKQQIETWMRSNVVLEIANQAVPPLGTTVEFFPAGQTPDEEFPDTPNASTGLSLFGTQVGVRMQYSGLGVPQPLKLIFERAPGVFKTVTIEVTSRAGQTSQQVSVSPGTVQPALVFEWPADAAANVPVVEAVTTPKVLEESFNPLSLSRTRPGVRGFCLGLFGLFLCVGIGFSSRSLSRTARYVSTAVGVCTFVASALLVADSKVVVDKNQALRLASRILTGVYRGTMNSSEEEAMEALSSVLHEDLVEEVYLSTLKSLSASPEDGIILDIGEVNVDSILVLPPDSVDQLTANCCWNVHGIVHHWGHSHSRELRLEGDLKMIRDSEGWKLLSISQTDSTNAAVLMAPAGVQLDKSRSSEVISLPDA